MKTTTSKNDQYINGQEYTNSIDYPVFRYASNGAPGGLDIAVLQETDLPVDLSGVNGSLGPNGFCWDGEGTPTDCNSNTIYGLWIRSDQDEWQRQYDEWNEE